MFLNKLVTYLGAHISESKRCLNVKSLAYSFHMKTKISGKFQISISVALTFENAFPQSFNFKANRKSIGFSKKMSYGFQNSPPFERSACFYVTNSESFKRFQYLLTLQQIFWKTKIFFKKLKYRVLVETTKIENTSFPFKTALSEANVQTNRRATTKWTYHNM